MTEASSAASLAGLGFGGPAATRRRDDLTERIARAAVTPPALETAKPAANEPPPRAEEIVVYWERLRRGRALPPLADLDRSLIAKGWPDSLVVLFDRDPAAMPCISRLGAAEGGIEYTPMVTDWILTRAREAARGVKPCIEVRDFPLQGERPRYRLFLLPLAAAAVGGDALLCHLCRID